MISTMIAPISPIRGPEPAILRLRVQYHALYLTFIPDTDTEEKYFGHL